MIRAAPSARNPFESDVAWPANAPPQILVEQGTQLLSNSSAINFVSTPADGSGGAQQQVPLRFYNVGTLPLVLNGLRLTDPASAFGIAGPPAIGTVIPSGDSVQFTLVFDPSSPGMRDATLEIQSNSGSDPVFSVQLSGEALSTRGQIELLGPTTNLGGRSLFDWDPIATGMLTLHNRGGGPLSIYDVRVKEGSDQFEVTGLPSETTLAQTFVLSAGQSLPLDILFAPTSTQLHRGVVQILTDDPDQPLVSWTILGTGISDAKPNLDVGSNFVVVQALGGNVAAARGRADRSGAIDFSVAPDEYYRILAFDPHSGLIAEDFRTSDGTGGLTWDGNGFYRASAEADSDGDGLPDDIEFTIGTAVDQRDTNRDGIDDFTSVRQGIDPVQVSLEAALRWALSASGGNPGSRGVARSAAGSGGTAGSGVTEGTGGVGGAGAAEPSEGEGSGGGSTLPLGPDTAHPILTNGDFAVALPESEQFGWTILGAAVVENGAGVLREDARSISEFSQTFNIPAGTRFLEFQLLAANLSANPSGPSDTLEVALLHADTHQSLVPTADGLANTDALLNLQANGDVYIGSRTQVQRIGGIDASVTIDDVRMISTEDLTVTVNLDSASDTGLAGDNLTLRSAVRLTGATLPSQLVSLDLDDDGTATADVLGSFHFDNVNLVEGTQAIRVQAVSAFGEAIASLNLTVDMTAPAGALIGPAPGQFVVVDNGYVDFQWTDSGLAGIDPTSLGIGDAVLTGVTVDRIELLENGRVRYHYGDGGERLTPGRITVQGVAGQVLDRAGNSHPALVHSFIQLNAACGWMNPVERLDASFNDLVEQAVPRPQASASRASRHDLLLASVVVRAPVSHVIGQDRRPGPQHSLEIQSLHADLELIMDEIACDVQRTYGS